MLCKLYKLSASVGFLILGITSGVVGQEVCRLQRLHLQIHGLCEES